MKKFIAPQVRVVRYDSSILCSSVGVGDDIGSGEVIDAEAPRRRGIFDDTDLKSTNGLK